MTYQPPPDPAQPGPGPQYYAPPPPPGAKAPWPAWKWGCLVAGILGVLALLGAGICCGIPGYRAANAYKQMGGMPGVMAMGWLANVQTGQLDSAAQLTVGGRSEVDKLAQKIRDEVGAMSDIGSSSGAGGMPQMHTEENKGAGTARVSVMLTGDKGTANCVLRMKQSTQTMWMVEDVTFEPASGTESLPSP